MLKINILILQEGFSFNKINYSKKGIKIKTNLKMLQFQEVIYFGNLLILTLTKNHHNQIRKEIDKRMGV
jgi:hypothetical protein